MSVIGRWNVNRVLIALALVTAAIPLAATVAEARVGVGISLGFPPIIAPPVVVAPPVAVAPAPPPPAVVPPPVVVGPPPYYALPPGYFYAPGYGYYWYDRWGRRHWARY